MITEHEKLIERLRAYRPPSADGYGYPPGQEPREHHPICDEAADAIASLLSQLDATRAERDGLGNELRHVLIINAVRRVMEETAPLWLESADHAVEKWANGVAALKHQGAETKPAPTHRHIKTGGLYYYVGPARMQAENWIENPGSGDPFIAVDLQEVAVYRSAQNGSLWVRPKAEFEERFEPLPLAQPQASREAR